MRGYDECSQRSLFQRAQKSFWSLMMFNQKVESGITIHQLRQMQHISQSVWDLLLLFELQADKLAVPACSFDVDVVSAK